MPKTSPTWDPAAYVTVAERIAAFYARFPTGRITTELRARSARRITFCAAVYRSPDESAPAATGWACERENDGEVNAVACLENAETSAVGRALVHLGFTTTRPPAARPADPAAPVATGGERGATDRYASSGSSTEVAAASSAPSSAPSNVAASAVAHARTRTGRPGAGTDEAPPAKRVCEVLQQAAAAVLDTLDLVAEAERAGLEPKRAAAVRTRLTTEAVAPSEVGRIERALRRWLADPSQPLPRL